MYARQDMAQKRVGKRRPKTLLPVMRPTFNFREICKQLSLLEDHMVHSVKRCRDCVNKHFLMAEGLAEECKSLCGQAALKDEAAAVARELRVYHHAIASPQATPATWEYVATRLRRLRKRLMKVHAALPLRMLPDAEAARVRAVLRASRSSARKLTSGAAKHAGKH